MTFGTGRVKTDRSMTNYELHTVRTLCAFFRNKFDRPDIGFYWFQSFLFALRCIPSYFISTSDLYFYSPRR